jgi:hypothetical protein
MSSEMTTFEQMKLVMEESKDAQKENVEEAHLKNLHLNHQNILLMKRWHSTLHSLY